MLAFLEVLVSCPKAQITGEAKDQTTRTGGQERERNRGWEEEGEEE